MKGSPLGAAARFPDKRNWRGGLQIGWDGSIDRIIAAGNDGSILLRGEAMGPIPQPRLLPKRIGRLDNNLRMEHAIGVFTPAQVREPFIFGGSIAFKDR